MRSVFDIKDFGAVGDGKTMNTRQIQTAIDECARSGGGLVEIGGVFLCGSVELKVLWNYIYPQMRFCSVLPTLKIFPSGRT